MTTYGPSETRTWSTSELADLVGRYVHVNVNGTDSEGWVQDANLGRFMTPYIAFYDGGEAQWNRDTDEVHVSVNDAPTR